MEFKDFSFHGLKSMDEEGTFEGNLAVYGNLDSANEIIDPGAFAKTLQEGGRIIPMLWQHDPQQPIGRLTLTDTPTALHAKGKLLLKLPKAQEAYELLKEGVLKGLSIGYQTIKAISADGPRRLKEIRLHEGSLVTFPANALAVVTGVKQATNEDLKNLQRLREASNDMKRFYQEMFN